MARMLVTLFTDASVYPNGVAGYGYWAKKQGMPSVTGGGQFKGTMMNSDDGEACAIANSISVLVKSGYIKEDHHVLIQTDSTAAIGAYEGKRIVLPFNVQRAVKHVIELAKKRKFSFSMRHVKGHTNKRGRHWCNTKTDQIARGYANGGQRSRTT